MKEPALVIIKPDGISKRLIGNVFTKFAQADLSIVGLRTVKTSRTLAEEHYRHLKGKPFFKQIVAYLAGEYHKVDTLLAIVYYGEDAIKLCRRIAGATSPEEAGPDTIRGSYGRITTDGLFENVVHVSSDSGEAEREIKLWFDPEDITTKLYPTKTVAVEAHKKKVWA